MDQDEKKTGCGCVVNGVIAITTVFFLGANLICTDFVFFGKRFGWPLSYGQQTGGWLPDRLDKVRLTALLFNLGLYAMLVGIALLIKRRRFGIRSIMGLMAAAVLLFTLYRQAQVDPIQLRRAQPADLNRR